MAQQEPRVEREKGCSSRSDEEYGCSKWGQKKNGYFHLASELPFDDQGMRKECANRPAADTHSDLKH
jgi:hypothetical protein